MPANYVLLGEVTVGEAGAASVTLANIPQSGYTDLKVVFSLRSNTTGVTEVDIELNNTNPTQRVLRGNGAAASSNTQIFATANASGTTSNTFSSGEVYIPNYTSTNAKSTSIDNVTENNGTTAYSELTAGLYSTVTTAVTSIRLADNYGSWVAGSTVYLYGIAAVGTTPVIAPFASGGDIIQNDGTYWYHAFLSSGTFTPQKALTADCLVVAGGGGSGRIVTGGGGAGGLLTFTGQSFISGLAQTITVGAGGTGSLSGSYGSGTNGFDSQIGSLTLVKGGGTSNFLTAGSTGGSGGGGGYNLGVGQAGGSGTSGQGNAGGAGATVDGSGGGGGAGAVGTAGTTTKGGNGGIGATSTFINAIGTTLGLGQLVSGNYYFAGGGGGGANGAGFTSANRGDGGSGGGGNGGFTNSSTSTDNAGIAGTANTGGGGGGAPNDYTGNNSNTQGKNGGSGVVIIRYPIA